ncbi:MAG: hypothetical protein U5P10_16720 [Spirochaetia bacterium]|nr:hypothetical protein [Spirochaetia bacterium]
MEHVVRVFVPPLGECAGKNTWEKALGVVESRLREKLEFEVRFEIVTLFSKEFFAYPEVASLVQSGEGEPPIVTLDDRVIQRGGKLRERTIREALEENFI